MPHKRLRVYVTRKIPQAGLELLEDKCELDIFSGDQSIPRQTLQEKVKSVDALLCLPSDKIDRDIMDRALNLKVISNYGVGYNNIEIDYATQKGIVVANTPGVLTDATADLSWALLLAVTRRIAEGDRMMRAGKFKGLAPMLLLGQDITGKTLGILGAGRIGTAMAERSRGWNMRILYFDRSENSYLEEKLGAQKVDLRNLLEQSDFVSIHLPLTPETHHLIDEAALKQMRSTAYLINTARGGIVDEAALVRALQKNLLAGAGLDVYENEPKISQELAALENVVLAPHIGSATVEARNEMARMAARNLLTVLQGEKPYFPVNPEVLKP